MENHQTFKHRCGNSLYKLVQNSLETKTSILLERILYEITSFVHDFLLSMIFNGLLYSLLLKNCPDLLRIPFSQWSERTKYNQFELQRKTIVISDSDLIPLQHVYVQGQTTLQIMKWATWKNTSGTSTLDVPQFYWNLFKTVEVTCLPQEFSDTE